jgi:hypothetical protein
VATDESKEEDERVAALDDFEQVGVLLNLSGMKF